MNTSERFAKIVEELAKLERERSAQDETWRALAPELQKAGKTELWVESLPEAPTTPSPALLGCVRA